MTIPFRNPKYLSARLRQHRRGHHAVDGVLPAVLGRGERAGRQRISAPPGSTPRSGRSSTQIIMAAVLVAVAATLGKAGGYASRSTRSRRSSARSPRSLAISAANSCSASAWAGGPGGGDRRDADRRAHPRRSARGEAQARGRAARGALVLRLLCAVALVFCAIVVGSGVNLVVARASACR